MYVHIPGSRSVDDQIAGYCCNSAKLNFYIHCNDLVVPSKVTSCSMDYISLLLSICKSLRKSSPFNNAKVIRHIMIELVSN